MASNWTEESINNTGFSNGTENIINPTPPAWAEQDANVSDTSIVLSDGWSVDVDGTLLDLTFKYNNITHFSINDNGTLGMMTHTELPTNADIGSIAMKGSDLYINKED
tara:strand:+ start:6081 stop:6404 length:324 start_codon:yes stop_codon:yes gene_type:complete